MSILLVDVRTQAEAEIAEELFRLAVDKHKEKLRARQWWHVLFPWKLMILRRET